MSEFNENNAPKFIVDENVGKLLKMLRMLGFDAVFFNGEDDGMMLRIAMAENRIVLTRDTRIFERHVVTSGKSRAVLIQSERIQDQIQQVVAALNLRPLFRPFTRCLEDNQPLLCRHREDIRPKVPPYVWQTQQDYVECPACSRIYWKGTHWQAMIKQLEKVSHQPEES